MSSQLGDYIRAIRELGPDPDEAEQIAGMLNLTRTRRRRTVSPVTPPPAPSTPSRPAQKPEVRETRAEEKDTAEATAFVLERISRPGTSRTPPWLASTTPIPIEKTRYRAPKLPLEPILAPKTVRSILSTLLATYVEEGGVDLTRMISVMARAEPFTHLYRLRSLTVRRGVQLLIDTAPSMSLYRRDALWLRRELNKVIGEVRVDVRLFADCPTRGVGSPAADSWDPWRPPPAGTPILLITDLGIGTPDHDKATWREWEVFLDAVKSAGCLLYALNPYAPHRWPAELARHIEVIPWRRALNVQAARKSARRVRGR